MAKVRRSWGWNWIFPVPFRFFSRYFLTPHLRHPHNQPHCQPAFSTPAVLSPIWGLVKVAKVGKAKPKNALKMTIKRETAIIKNPKIRIRNLFRSYKPRLNTKRPADANQIDTSLKHMLPSVKSHRIVRVCLWDSRTFSACPSWTPHTSAISRDALSLGTTRPTCSVCG